MCQRKPAFGHHLHQVSQAQLESKIPAHAQDDDLAVEVASLEQLFHTHQLAHGHPLRPLGRHHSRSEPAACTRAVSRLLARCEKLRGYLDNNEAALIDYSRRYHSGQPVSTSRAEGCVDEIANA